MKFKLTLTILIVNTILFIIAFNNNFDIKVLIQMGAINKYYDYQVWRLITYVFLHSSISHYLGNMLFGIPLLLICENKIGYKKLILSMTITTILTGFILLETLQPHHSVVGYSVLIYATAGMLLQSKNKYLVTGIIICVVIGLVSSIINPVLSLNGHLSGFIIGYISSMIGGQYEREIQYNATNQSSKR